MLASPLCLGVFDKPDLVGGLVASEYTDSTHRCSIAFNYEFNRAATYVTVLHQFVVSLADVDKASKYFAAVRAAYFVFIQHALSVTKCA